MAQRAHPDMLEDDNLRRLYERIRGPVAFLDESYRLPGPRGPGFYSMTGVLFESELFVEHRQALLAVGRTPGGGPWHTTAAYHEERRDQIRAVIGEVVDRAEWSIVTVEVPMESGSARDEAKARAGCLTQLAAEFTRSGPQQVQLLVLDTRSTQGDQADQKTLAALRGSGAVPSRTLLRHSSDADEPLLCAPDAISWATRRLLAVDDPGWIEPAADSMTLINAATNEHVDVGALAAETQQRQGGLSPHPAPGLDIGSQGSGILSPLSLSQVSHDGAERSTPLTNIDTLAARALALRERAAQKLPASEPERPIATTERASRDQLER